MVLYPRLAGLLWPEAILESPHDSYRVSSAPDKRGSAPNPKPYQACMYQQRPEACTYSVQYFVPTRNARDSLRNLGNGYVVGIMASFDAIPNYATTQVMEPLGPSETKCRKKVLSGDTAQHLARGYSVIKVLLDPTIRNHLVRNHSRITAESMPKHL